MSQIDITLQEIITKTNAKKQGAGWSGHCPAHKDKKPSFSIAFDFVKGIGLYCHVGCDIDSICAALNITQADLFPPKQPQAKSQAQAKPNYGIERTYDYRDESGNLLFQVVRQRLKNPTQCPNEPRKKFIQRRPDGASHWVYGLSADEYAQNQKSGDWYKPNSKTSTTAPRQDFGETRRVLYRLPELLAALVTHPDTTVFVVEGEKDVDRLRSLGFVATCNPGGAGKWRDDYSDSLIGYETVVLPDNDPQATNPDGTLKLHPDGQPVLPGQDHAQAVAASLHGKAKSVRLLELPGLKPKGDVSDWLDAGHDQDELSAMVEAAPEWTPAANAQSPDEWEAPAPFFDFDPPDFPIEVFPTYQQSFVESLASATQTPIDLAALLSLGVCGASVARVVRIEARDGWQEPLNIYIIIALPPANRKSQVFVEATYPLFAYERELILNTRDRIAEEASEYRTLEAELAELEKRAAKATDLNERDALKQEAKAKARDLAARKKPVLPKRIVDDVTSEVIPTILVEQDGRLALFSAEGGIVGTVGGRYSNGIPNIDVILKGHSGDDLRVDRRDRSEHIERPALTIGLAVQPNILRALGEKPEFRERGLTSRFLYSLPTSTVGHRKIRPGAMLDEARQTYANNVKRLAEIEPSINTDGESEPRLIRLSKDADDYLASFEEEIEPKLGPDGDLSSIADWGGKLAGAAVRLAGILHLAQYADSFNLNGKWPAEVSADTMKNAIKIARYLIPHAQAAYAEMGADSKIEDAKFLLRWIEKSGLTEFTKRDAYQGTKGRFKQVVAMEPALKALEDHGYIRAVDSQTPNRPGRRPSEKFLVNPLMSRP